MDGIRYSTEVKHALAENGPLVALETAVLTHGLPHPKNIETAQAMEEIVRAEGGVPATIGVLRGTLHLGLNDQELNQLAVAPERIKISRRDLGWALAEGKSGGTTVAGTLTALARSPIKVFATGGIGGVHRGRSFDISADLPALGGTPAVVVCSGAKSILDLPATLEYLETVSVPVLGWRTDEFPAFYSRSSGLGVPVRVDEVGQVAGIAQHHWEAGVNGAVLLVVPVPEEQALEEQVMTEAVDQALQEADHEGHTGQAVTPFLLDRVSELTGGASLDANLSLLKNNARIAARTAQAFSRSS